MCTQSMLSDINWLSVLVASIAGFAVGAVWYTPILFGKIWIKLIGANIDENNKPNMPMIFGTALVLQFIAAIGLEMVLGKDACAVHGLTTGLFISIFWIATSFGINYLFVRRPLKLFFIDAGYYAVSFMVMGIILGAW